MKSAMISFAAFVFLSLKTHILGKEILYDKLATLPDGHNLYFEQEGDRWRAAYSCEVQGSHLPYVKTNGMHDFMMKYKSKPFYLGLTCIDNNPKSCLWDDGTEVEKEWFAKGHPNISFGHMVYMNGSEWYSDSGVSFERNTCQYNFTDGCSDGYIVGPRGCYKLFNEAKTFQKGGESCKSDGGYLTYYTSTEEERFLQTLKKRRLSGQILQRAFIGLTTNSSVDPTIIDPDFISSPSFSDRELENQCFALEGDDPFYSTIVSHPCANSLPYICRRERQIREYPANPKICNSITMITKSMTIFSPGYPTAHFENNCIYQVHVPAQYEAEVTAEELSIGTNSILQIDLPFKGNQVYLRNKNETVKIRSSSQFKSYTSTMRSTIRFYAPAGEEYTWKLKIDFKNLQ